MHPTLLQHHSTNWFSHQQKRTRTCTSGFTINNPIQSELTVSDCLAVSMEINIPANPLKRKTWGNRAFMAIAPLQWTHTSDVQWLWHHTIYAEVVYEWLVDLFSQPIFEPQNRDNFLLLYVISQQNPPLKNCFFPAIGLYSFSHLSSLVLSFVL